MALKLKILLLGMILFGSDACSTNDRQKANVESPPEPEGITRVLGGNVAISSFRSGATGQPIRSNRELACSFGAGCRWHNGPGDNLDWSQASGRADSTLFEERTGTSQMPSDPYGIVFPDRAFPEGRAWLISDPIVCQTGDGELTFSYWTSRYAKFKVCARTQGNPVPEYCSDSFSVGDPGPALARVPIGGSRGPIEILIEASNFRDRNDFAIIDDIQYNARLC